MSSPYSRAPENGAPTPIYVGLDLSLSSTGIATITSAFTTVARVKTKPAGSSSRDKANRLDRIIGLIRAEIPRTDDTVVAVEGPAFASNDRGAHMRGGLWWMVRSMLEDDALDVLVIPPSNVKKYATGRGNAGKDEVLAATIRRYPDVDITGNDEADAYVLAAMAARYTGHPIEASLPEAHLAAMKGVGR
ncbi:crossover junction endodeoxyribonuclease RuvC [Microbacterium sp. gxy059]|uniref:crossover junction endodeoxyribonuclease RuvC n=1 Tax=Microbacterium sp. gxy059 TaxID=2957199 RepID=UPI003D969BD7